MSPWASECSRASRRVSTGQGARFSRNTTSVYSGDLSTRASNALAQGDMYGYSSLPTSYAPTPQRSMHRPIVMPSDSGRSGTTFPLSETPCSARKRFEPRPAPFGRRPDLGSTAPASHSPFSRLHPSDRLNQPTPYLLQLATTYWPLTTGYWPLATDYWLLATVNSAYHKSVIPLPLPRPYPVLHHTRELGIYGG